MKEVKFHIIGLNMNQMLFIQKEYIKIYSLIVILMPKQKKLLKIVIYVFGKTILIKKLELNKLHMKTMNCMGIMNLEKNIFSEKLSQIEIQTEEI